MRTISHLRVSTEGQDLEKNKSDILKFANEKRRSRWVLTHVSNKQK